MKRKVVVTQEHIDRGIKGDPSLCPLALALKAAGCLRPSVFNTCFRSNWSADISSLTSRAQIFVFRGDSLGRSALKPATFILDLPPLEESA